MEFKENCCCGPIYLELGGLRAAGLLDQSGEVCNLGAAEIVRPLALGLVDAEPAGVVGRLSGGDGRASVGEGRRGVGGAQRDGLAGGIGPLAASGADNVEAPVGGVSGARGQDRVARARVGSREGVATRLGKCQHLS